MNIITATTLCAAGFSASAALAQQGTLDSCEGWSALLLPSPSTVLNIPITVTDSCTLLRITDDALAGDRFRVRIRQGSRLVRSFETSVPAGGDSGFAGFEFAYSDPRWSSGATVLDPGNYIMQVSLLDGPFSSASAGYSFAEAAPSGFGLSQAGISGDGTSDNNDCLEFRHALNAEEPCADLDEDGLYTIFDFLAFQNIFDAGC